MHNKHKSLISVLMSLVFFITSTSVSLSQDKMDLKKDRERLTIDIRSHEAPIVKPSESFEEEEIEVFPIVETVEEPPMLEEPAAFKPVKSEKVEKKKKPSKRRRKTYKLTLDECIDIAMHNHLPLKISEKQLKLAKFRLLEAQRKMLPSVTFKWEESSGRVNSRAYTGEKFTAEGKQPIFYGGELIYSVKQARTNVEIVRTDYERIRNDLILQVKKAYYSLDKAKKAVRIQEKLQRNTARLYAICKSGYEAGVIAQVEYFKVSSQYNQANFQLVSAKEDTSVANLLLQQAMNVDEEVSIANVDEPKIIELDLDSLFNIAYLNRPEMKISDLSLAYFDYEVKIMKARSGWPRVDFLGSYGNTREDYVKADLGNPAANPRDLGPEWYYGAKVSVPFWGSTLGYSYTNEKWQPVVSSFHGTEAKTHSMTLDVLNKLDDISGTQEAELELLRSHEEMNTKKEEIALEVKETFFKYKKAILLTDVAKSKVLFQSKQVEVLDIRRELGEAQFSDVIEEMIKLAEEEFSYIQAIADYYIAIATLNKAVGIEDYIQV